MIRRTVRPLLVVAFAAVLVLGSQTAASADPDWDIGGGDGGVDVGGSDGSGGSSGGNNGGGGGSPIYTAPQPWTQFAYQPYCSANTPPENNDTTEIIQMGPDAMCTGATTGCEEGQNRFWAYSRTISAAGVPTSNWTNAGIRCRGGDEDDEGGPPEITLDMVVDAARALAPKPTVSVEPAVRSYVNVPTNVSVESGAEIVDVTVLGLALPVRFEPVEFRWSFGDGGTASGAGVAGADVGQEGAVEHEYRRGGQYAITVERGYRATVTLPNGQSIELPELIRNSSAPYALGVGEIQSRVTGIG